MLNMTDSIKVIETGVNPVIADIDDLIDLFVMNEYEGPDVDVSGIIAAAKPSQVSAARAYYKALQKEVAEDREIYDHLTIPMRMSYIEFLDGILCQMQSTRKHTKPRKVRKARAKTPDQIVKGIKYLKKDKESGIESIDPVKLVGSTSLWVFNVKLRKLTKYVSLPGMTLSLKGTTIQNMDVSQSVSKTIRKPEIVLPIVASDAKNMIEARFKDIKARGKLPNGRIGKDTLLIRTFK